MSGIIPKPMMFMTLLQKCFYLKIGHILLFQIDEHQKNTDFLKIRYSRFFPNGFLFSFVAGGKRHIWHLIFGRKTTKNVFPRYN